MTPRAKHAATVLVLALSLAGCRQPDGPLPTPEGDVPNRLGDISRDLASVARGDAQARQDLAEDLEVFVDETTGDAPALDALVKQTADVVNGKELSDQDAQRLAHQLWTAVAAREMSERQVETLQNDMHGLLVSIGVTEGEAEQVAARVGEVQNQVTARPRRWYEFF